MLHQKLLHQLSQPCSLATSSLHHSEESEPCALPCFLRSSCFLHHSGPCALPCFLRHSGSRGVGAKESEPCALPCFLRHSGPCALPAAVAAAVRSAAAGS